MKKYLLLMFVGLALMANGWDGLRLSWTAGDEPEKINLAELENGKKPASTYIELGEHYRLTSNIVYSVLKRKNSVVDSESIGVRAEVAGSGSACWFPMMGGKCSYW